MGNDLDFTQVVNEGRFSYCLLERKGVVSFFLFFFFLFFFFNNIFVRNSLRMPILYFFSLSQNCITHCILVFVFGGLSENVFVWNILTRSFVFDNR